MASAWSRKALYLAAKLTASMSMPMRSAADTASTRSSRVEQYSSSSSSSQFFMKRPVTSWPARLSSSAATAESTPPDMPTTTFMVRFYVPEKAKGGAEAPPFTACGRLLLRGGVGGGGVGGLGRGGGGGRGGSRRGGSGLGGIGRLRRGRLGEHVDRGGRERHGDQGGQLLHRCISLFPRRV